eukprot:GILK01008466.1.p1 GENE.GILK01008466.1~~GILK01008466.1.p1  ORF type:complete len:430 (+),score=45.14 GILK01008466.1:51-1292(+)
MTSRALTRRGSEGKEVLVPTAIQPKGTKTHVHTDDNDDDGDKEQRSNTSRGKKFLSLLITSIVVLAGYVIANGGYLSPTTGDLAALLRDIRTVESDVLELGSIHPIDAAAQQDELPMTDMVCNFRALPEKYEKVNLKDFPFGRMLLYPQLKDVEVSEFIRRTQTLLHDRYKRMFEEIFSVSNPVVLEIGSHIGMYTMYMVALGAEVHAFEPVATNFEFLRCNAFINQREPPSLSIYPLAVADRKDTAVCLYPMDHAAKGGKAFGCRDFRAPCAQFSNPNKPETCISVNVTTVDNYLDKMRNNNKNNMNYRIASQPLHLLKISTNGFELRVLEGARNLLANNPPPFILLEFFAPWVRESDRDPRDLFSMLSALGYTAWLPGWDQLTPGMVDYYLETTKVYDRTYILFKRPKDSM